MGSLTSEMISATWERRAKVLDGWMESNRAVGDSLVEKATYSLDAPLVIRDEGEELFSEEEDQRGRSLGEAQHLLQHRQNAFPMKHKNRE